MANYQDALELLIEDLDNFQEEVKLFEEAKKQYTETGEEALFYETQNHEQMVEYYDDHLFSKISFVAALFEKDFKKVRDDVYRLKEKRKEEDDGKK